MIQAHLHVGQSQPHTSEAPILQFLGKSRKRKRRSLDTNDWISIRDYKIKGNSHTQYLIRLKVDNVVWSFWTRYSMLSELHQILDQLTKSQLPAFPVKRLFGNLNPDFISTRKAQLDVYLQAIFRDPQVRDSKVFQDFISNSKQKAFKKADLDSLHQFKLDLLLTFVHPIPIADPRQLPFLNNLDKQQNQNFILIVNCGLFLRNAFLQFSEQCYTYKIKTMQLKNSDCHSFVNCDDSRFVCDYLICFEVAKQSNIQLSIEKKQNQSD
ncbi:unnamed protein product [Paramecium octaurelia]|uniref:PX domain-containing protein n=1 Tax=Paramecium octaurelia TaxID=43137 RepID=A0A8S1WU96_PAROT|nr:unnamed protein product [Paramecium octaurelia]